MTKELWLGEGAGLGPEADQNLTEFVFWKGLLLMLGEKAEGLLYVFIYLFGPRIIALCCEGWLKSGGNKARLQTHSLLLDYH